jgi:RNA 2',3'-cyclic 3'-phosphodiesterase
VKGVTERLFVGVPVPTRLAGFVGAAQQALPSSPELRLLGAAQWHITVAFIGDVSVAAKAAIAHIVEQVPGDIGGGCILGGFLMLPSPSRTRVVALDVDDRNGVFGRLYEAVVGPLEAAGIVERERRPYRPHLTIARLRTPGVVSPRVEVGTESFEVESLCLYRSELRRTGAEYSVIARRAVCGKV